ncbi:MAG: hypothetical protein LBE62_08545 [Azonexus sp.]|jgi:hypothetical protein|nr:hypothetical protein [Azonexus sp.]
MSAVISTRFFRTIPGKETEALQFLTKHIGEVKALFSGLEVTATWRVGGASGDCMIISRAASGQALEDLRNKAIKAGLAGKLSHPAPGIFSRIEDAFWADLPE